MLSTNLGGWKEDHWLFKLLFTVLEPSYFSKNIHSWDCCIVRDEDYKRKQQSFLGKVISTGLGLHEDQQQSHLCSGGQK